LLLMMSEAIAWRGVDNLVVPVASVALLKIYLSLSAADLLVRLAVLVVLTVVLLWWRNKTTLIGEGALAAVLFLYGAWALGGWLYLISPMLLLFLLVTLPRAKTVPRLTIHGVGVVLALCAPGLCYLLLTTRGLDLLLPYSVAFSAATAVAVLTEWHSDLTHWPQPPRLLGAMIVGTLVGLSPLLLLASHPGLTVWVIAMFSATFLATTLSFAPSLVRLTGRHRWSHRGVAIAAASFLGLIARTILLEHAA
jgi:phytol kinase